MNDNFDKPLMRELALMAGRELGKKLLPMFLWSMVFAFVSGVILGVSLPLIKDTLAAAIAAW